MTEHSSLISNSLWLKQVKINQYLQCKWTKGWNNLLDEVVNDGMHTYTFSDLPESTVRDLVDTKN